MATDLRDVFICHAGEDEVEVVRPLTRALQTAQISYWVDDEEVLWGDSLIASVNRGLKISRFVIVVLSPAFLQKSWPRTELEAMLNLEASTGEVRVLPLIVGTHNEQKKILAELPLLNQKRYIPWAGNPAPVIRALKERLDRSTPDTRPSGARPTGGRDLPRVPLPRRKSSFSESDRVRFARAAFTEIERYFEQALQILQQELVDVETDLEKVHRYRFRATAYLRGRIANQCLVWLGGLMGDADSISYREGPRVSVDDRSVNDWLSVVSDGERLGLRSSGMAVAVGHQRNDSLLTPLEAAEYLWHRFIARLD